MKIRDYCDVEKIKDTIQLYFKCEHHPKQNCLCESRKIGLALAISDLEVSQGIILQKLKLTLDVNRVAEIISSFLIEGEGIDETEIAEALKSKAGEIIVPPNNHNPKRRV